MNVKKLVVMLRIEEINNVFEKKFLNPAMAKANIVEHGQSSKAKKFIGGGSKLGPRKYVFKKKIPRKCNCGGPSHKASECTQSKKNHESNSWKTYLRWSQI